MAGIYIHIPFCSQFCTYCDFYSVKQRAGRGVFTEALIKELESRAGEFKKRGFTADTIYFGGGTPSLLSPDTLGNILESITRLYPAENRDKREVTIEVNPDDMTSLFAKEIFKRGFNRLSLGVQSFRDEHLRWMNRRHNSGQASDAITLAREAGFENISLDLIFGFEMLTAGAWRDNISKAIELNPEHISAYQMSLERGTTLYKQFKNGLYNHLPDAASYEQYTLLQEMLESAGYIQYEISSFARHGKNSLHNSNYWNYTPYFGFGPAAHSFDGEKRSWNLPSLSRYLKAMDGGESCQGEEILSPVDRFNEYIMLSLRQIEGMNIQYLNEETSIDISESFFKTLSKHLRDGNLIEESGQIKIPSRKLFVSDGIIRELFI
ncbi:MAG: radical SAM family heme chaperone HemW [Bacteroidales bacterium]